MIKGILCDGQTSCHKEVVLICDENSMLHFQGSDIAPVNLKSAHISPRLANTSRFIKLPDGGQFETTNNDAVDLLARGKGDGASKAARLIYTLETYKTWVLTAFIILVVGTGTFIKYGMPYISNSVAMALPMEASLYIGDNMQDGLEEYWQDNSLLEPERQQQLRDLFSSLLPVNTEDVPWKISFREGGAMGANAFALPNGTVIFTDELVFLADNDQQLAAIMLHEIGHVQHRHSLRRLIQDFSLALLLMAISGDVSSSSGIITALPVILLESGYSQDMEWESDTYALEEMQRRDLNPERFAEIMSKMESQMTPQMQSNANPTLKTSESNETTDEPRDTELASTAPEIENNSQTDTQTQRPVWQYFSTHPAT
ncbi:MAG: M48 family metallopeptidase, partial [Gammaproteobacteria bacterium]|nr:M48 family metallopeptidase [Gammaproteobacteria bacterium]